MVGQVRISRRRERPPLGFGVRTHAWRSFLPMSSSGAPLVQYVHEPHLLEQHLPKCRPQEPQGWKSLVRVLPQQSTVPVSGFPTSY